MRIYKKTCRCCGENTFNRLGNDAELCNFFMQYGLQISVTVETDPISLFLEKVEDKLPSFLARLFPRIRRALRLPSQNKYTATMPCGLCSTCNFLSPWPEISNDHLLDYYTYYLAPEYKEARVKSQPNYAAIAPVHGSPQEFMVRRNAHTAFMASILEKHIASKRISDLRLLDYGGGDGGIQPILSVAEIHTYDVGNRPPLKNFYDVVQCMHVLEHVGNPLATCRDAFDCCTRGGLLYVEVPHEFTTVEDCLNGKAPSIDEHINKFSIPSIRAMLKKLDCDILFVEEGVIDILHLEGSARVIRGLARKK
jgi:hypothetical protein